MESHVADIWTSCLCAVVFLLLLLWDVCKALKRRAHWAPGHALFLSALTIQMLAMIHISDISSVSSKHEMNQQVTSLLKEDQLLFDCARLMMCVFMAYLLPTMVPRSNWSRVWSDIGALLLSVMVSMAFEVYFVWKVAKPFYRIPNRRQSVWFIVSNTTLFTASLLLFFLLSCAVLAGKSIRSILPRKVHWALSCCSISNSPYSGECKNPCCSKSDFPYRGECKNPCCSRSNPPSPYFGECKNPCCSKSDFPYRGECKNPCCSTSNAPSPYSGECKNPCCSTSNAPSPYCGECKNPCCSKSDFPYRGECKKSCSSDTAGPCDDWCCSQYPEKCKTTEDHVLKCWIVARVSQPEYIMARSVFSSLAGVVVTIAVVVFVIKWACLHLPLDYGIAHKTTIFIELAFILVGWMAVSFRWLTAVMFFPRKAEFLFFLEDFWTMSILDLKADLDAQLTRPVYKMKKFSQRREGQKFLLNLMTAVRLHSVLLPMRVWLLMLVVWLSKACWGLSQMLTGMIRPFVMWILHGSCGRREGSKFSETLESLRMPGETAYDLWIANKMAFESTQSNMKRGIKKGEGNSAKLNKLIEHRPDELKAEDDKYFIETRRMSLKRKGISLLYCMIHFYEDSINFGAINDAVVANSISRDIKNDVTKAFETARVINKARKACSKAWDFLDFVDGSDVAADAEFHNLVNMWHKHYKNMKAVKMATEQQRNATALKNWHGSKDWMRLTVDCNLYNKLYKKFYSFDKNSHPDHQELAIKKLRRRLAYLVHDCLVNQLGKVLIEKCNKWAEEGKEEEIFHAAFIAGKGKGLRDKIPKCVADAG